MSFLDSGAELLNKFIGRKPQAPVRVSLPIVKEDSPKWYEVAQANEATRKRQIETIKNGYGVPDQTVVMPETPGRKLDRLAKGVTAEAAGQKLELETQKLLEKPE